MSLEIGETPLAVAEEPLLPMISTAEMPWPR